MNSRGIAHRRIALEWPADTRAAWQPIKPEFSAAVNALSIGMPHGEPYVMRAVRRAAADIDDPELRAEVDEYLRQEGEHSRQHRRFNELLIAQHPSLGRVERWLARSYGFLERRMGDRFGIAYAAGFEATAFAAARWINAKRHELFRGADVEPPTLILWHLAEEVEHKTVAHDVWAATSGNRLDYFAAMTTCFAMLVWFIFLRDGGCVICNARPSGCEAHHVVWVEHGGPTDLDNLVLPCSHHHHLIHDVGWRLRQDSTGRWTLDPP